MSEQTASAPAGREVRGRLPLEELAQDGALLQRCIVRLAWPVAAEMLLQTITQIVDMMMVSRLGPEAVAAVGFSFRPMFFALSIFLGLGAGTTALVARCMGRREPELASRVVHQAVLSTIALAGSLALAFYALAPRIQSFMGAGPQVLHLGVDYLRALAWGMTFAYTSIVIAAGLRGAGDTHTTMRVGLFTNVLNVILNYALIFGNLGAPALGVYGAGIATSIARAVGTIALGYLLLSRRLVIALPHRLVAFDASILVRIVRVGLPATAERALLSLAMLLHLRMVAREGTLAVAAATLSQNIEELAYMPSIGLAVAAATLVGQFLGDGRPAAAERAGWQSVRLGIFFMGSMGALFVIAPRAWLSLFAPAPPLIPLASDLVRIMGLAQPFGAAALILSGGLRGAGATVSVMAATALGMWVVRLGLTSVLMAHGWGATGAWWAVLVDSLLRAGVLAWIFARGGWQRIRL
jgi:putative MATE family efflux protein